MHWGHAVSSDLVTWEELPISLYPDELGTIFSGSAVIDEFNNTGLQTGDTDLLVAIFTHAGETQQQSIAFSNDNGHTMEKYDGNPVLPNPGILDFRDPKVLRYNDEKWIQVLAAGDRIIFYTSDDLLTWDKLSEFGANPLEGSHDGVWECPDLLPLEIGETTIWVLLVSINPGAPNFGSGTQYFLGDFDGTTFRSYGWNEFQWLDWGWDNYAGVTFANEPNKRKILIGWMNNWMYANEVPTSPWRGQMTLPRELSLQLLDGKVWLASNPISELTELRTGQIRERYNATLNAGSFLFLQDGISFRNSLLEVDINLSFKGNPWFAICFANYLEEEVCFGYKHEEREFYMDRSKSGNVNFHPDFYQYVRATRPGGKQSMNIKIYLDDSSIEAFADNGITAMTGLFFPTEPLFLVYMFNVQRAFASDVFIESAVIRGLNSIHGC